MTDVFLGSDPRRPSIRIVIPYFGQWPNWFPLFLETCRRNPSIDWLFLTDCGIPEHPIPRNTTFRAMTLPELLTRARKTLDVRADWSRAYKICELRPAFGELFAPELRGYTFFGWGDVDVVYGNVRKFIPRTLMNYHIVSFCGHHLSGHLCLVRNDSIGQSWFRDLEDWKARMEGTEDTRLDEPEPRQLPAYLHLWAQEAFTTPLSPIIRWTDGTFDFPKEWTWFDGVLRNDKDGDREFAYLHFMHWKGGAWPRKCGNAQWEKLDRLVHLDPRDAHLGFRINERGFFRL